MDVKLRQVEKRDWNFILELRNSFYNFFYKQDKPLKQDEHFEYMEKQKSNPNFHQWVIEYDDEDAGYVRILENDVGIMIKKEFQGKGVASVSLSLVEKEAVKLGIKKLVALVKPGNESSEKIFKKNGYILKMHWLEKVL